MARAEFSNKTKLAAWLRCKGGDIKGTPICECGCGAKIENGNGPEYHHKVDAWVGGSNDLDNCQVLRKKPCHSLITAKETVPQVAKTKRIANKRANIKPKGRPLPGTKASGLRKRMSGQVERW